MNAPAPRGIFQNPTGKFAWLEITNKCNLECIHCYAESGPFEPLNQKISTKGWKDIISQLRDAGFAGVQFIGGEPMLHPDLKELIAFSREVGMTTVEVFTNGTRVNSDWVDFFKGNKVKVALSFYSNQSTVHAKITKNNSSFDRTLAAIDALMDAKIPVRVGLISMAENKAQIAATVDFLKSKGINDIRVDRNREIGRGCVSAGSSEGELFKQLCGACGSNKIAIDSNGDVFPCVFSHEFLLGNINQDDWQNAVGIPLEEFLTGMSKEMYRRETEVEAFCNPFRCNPDQTCNPDYECAPDPPPGGPCP